MLKLDKACKRPSLRSRLRRKDNSKEPVSSLIKERVFITTWMEVVAAIVGGERWVTGVCLGMDQENGKKKMAKPVNS